MPRCPVWFAPLLAGLLVGSAATAGQQPIALDASTIAARSRAARSLVPLLREVRDRATSRVAVAPGSAPDSPFAGTQTTLLSFTLSRRGRPLDPEVGQAMDRLLAWEPGDRSNEELSRLFDEWLDQLSQRATGLRLQTSTGACDTDCVVRTMTRLDETWGERPRDRAEARDAVLLDALSEAVKALK